MQIKSDLQCSVTNFRKLSYVISFIQLFLFYMHALKERIRISVPLT